MCGKSDWTEAALPGAFFFFFFSPEQPFWCVCVCRVQPYLLPGSIKSNTTDPELHTDGSLSAADTEADRITLVVAHKYSDKVQPDVPRTEANSVNHVSSWGSFTT